MNRVVRIFTLVAVPIAVLVAGCGETVIDRAKAEDAIQADLEGSIHAKISGVECPSDQKVEAGATFSCTVDYANGKQSIATLKIRNQEADVSFIGLKESN